MADRSAESLREALPPARIPQLPAELALGLLVRGSPRLGRHKGCRLTGQEPTEPAWDAPWWLAPSALRGASSDRAASAAACQDVAAAIDYPPVHEVTPNEIAKTLGVTGLTFRNWLRAQKAAGQSLVAGHKHRTRYRFTPGEAEQLIAEYRSSKGTTPARPTVPVARPRRQAASAATARRPTLPALPRSLSRRALEGAGFVGWATWRNLRLSNYSPIPALPGAYVVYRPTADSPVFVQPSRAGWFKGEDPTVPEARLRSEWVEGAHVVYIGKADVLRRRLTQFGQFGAGEPVGHRGGRLIWQLADAGDLLVAWHDITWDEAARDYERRLLAAFAEQHGGRRPFANLTG
jgi:hypothetical protein